MPSSLMSCLFGNQSGPFSGYYSTSSTARATLIPEGGAGIINTLPAARRAHLAWPHGALGFQGRLGSEGPGMLGWAQMAGLEPGCQAPHCSSVSCYVTLAGKMTHFILKMTPFLLITDGEMAARRH